ncbi:ABC transporter permease [Nocardiopsis sediminis]|uniref:ABC transporter permease n=1 Tax=Nocardiopsis sediminis TaxID=1778267 RepID=A0ABV8FSX1_9ACTN
MSGALARTVAAELIKLRGLPAVPAAAAGTVGAGAALTAALAASAPRTDAVQVMAETVPFVQVGPILIGVLAVAAEYDGRQIATSLATTPNRPLLLASKAIASLVVIAATGAATVGAGLAAAWLTSAARGVDPPQIGDGWPAVGAAGHLVLIGLLALAVAALLRSLIPPLTTMLALVLVASPLLSGYTEHARWLPDRAGSALYLPGADTVLTPATGALVLAGWVAATALAAVTAFVGRDA